MCTGVLLASPCQGRAWLLHCCRAVCHSVVSILPGKGLCRVRAGPGGIPKHMLAKRLGTTAKKAHKMLAAFQKRYGILESEQQQGRTQMKARCSPALPAVALPAAQGVGKDKPAPRSCVF